jgi:hypothetical protein
MTPPVPTFTVATENTPVPKGPGIIVMPLLVSVAAKATMSGAGVPGATSSRVLSPGMLGAVSVLTQAMLNATSVGANGALGVTASTKLWAVPAGISAVVLGALVT